MKRGTVVKVYERSIRQLIQKDKNSPVKGEFNLFVKILDGHEILKKVVLLDIFTPNEKKDVLKALFLKLKFSELFQNIFFFLVDERRINILPDLFKELTLQDDLEKGLLSGFVENAPGCLLNDAELKELVDVVCKKMNVKVQLDQRENKKIVAGHRVIVNDFLLDATLDHQLEKLRVFLSEDQV